MKKIVIVHYMPLELYPPATNFINYLEKEFFDHVKLNVFSTTNNHNRKTYHSSFAQILRYSLPSQNENVIFRLLKYLSFNIGVFLQLIKLRPESILYYESYSALPVFLYSKFINPKSRILIHNHEYSPPHWYSQGMSTVKFYHKLEKTHLYLKAIWISQTNCKRTSLFLTDHPYIKKKALKTIPNYPSKSSSRKQVKNFVKPIKMVYLGSLSIRGFYLKEICDFVQNQNGVFELDIYCYNMDEEANEFLNKQDSEFIHFINTGINYEDFPETLVNYDIGIILYKANTLNQKYCAPNKLFEYLACDLDVWYPEEMIGVGKYKREKYYPKIIEVDYNKLYDIPIEKILNRQTISYKPTRYYYEYVFDELAEKFLNKD